MMKPASFSKVQPYFSIVLTALIFIYLALRSAMVPIIHDEAITYFAYIAPFDFIPGYAYWDANNHLLFSAIGALINTILPYSILTVRLGSLVFFPLYALFSYRIGKQLYSPLIGSIFFTVMITAPFTIEFFSLARGYGIGLTFFTGLIYQILKQQEANNYHSILLIIAYAILCLLGNLSFFVGVAMVIGYFFISWFINNKPTLIHIATRAGIFVAALLPLVYYMFELKNRGLLYYGGDEILSFFLRPFTKAYFTNKHLWPILLIPFFAAITLAVLHLVPKKRFTLKPYSLFPIVLLFSVIGIVSLQWLLNVNYPEDRASLYFFPLVIGVIFNAINSISGKWNWVIALPLLWFPIDLGMHANVSYSRLWDFEHVPDRFYSHVKFQPDGYPTTFSARSLRKHVWSIAQIGNNQASYVSSSDAPSTIADYILIDSTRVQQVNHELYKVIDYDSISGQSFFERKNKIQWITYTDTLLSEINTPNEYFNLFEYVKNPFDSSALKLHLAFTPPQKSNQYPLTLICSVFDTTGGTIFYEKLNLDERTTKWEPREYKFSQYLPPLPANAGRIVFYLYNPNVQQYKMRDVKASIFTHSGDIN